MKLTLHGLQALVLEILVAFANATIVTSCGRSESDPVYPISPECTEETVRLAQLNSKTRIKICKNNEIKQNADYLNKDPTLLMKGVKNFLLGKNSHSQC